MRAFKFIVGGAFVLITLFGIVSREVSVWRECRADHSWYYCMRVLNK